MLFHQDNAPKWRWIPSRNADLNLSNNCITHPQVPLAPSDHYLFLKMKKKLSCCLCNSDEDVITTVDHILEVQDADFNKAGNHMLHDHWIMCANEGKAYVEK